MQLAAVHVEPLGQRVELPPQAVEGLEGGGGGPQLAGEHLQQCVGESAGGTHVPGTDDGARALAGHMGAREAVCAISERVGCRSYRQKGNPLQAAPLPSREGNPLARRLSLPPRHSTLPGYSRSGQADPACASIKNT